MINLQDGNVKPDVMEISKYIENAMFDEFYEYMIQTYRAIIKIEYSKDVWLRGWNIKFRKSGRSLCVIYPKKNYFTVLVVIGPKEHNRVEALLPQLSKEIQKVSHETIEGLGQKWLLIDIYVKNNTYQDVLKLIQIRKETIFIAG